MERRRYQVEVARSWKRRDRRGVLETVRRKPAIHGGVIGRVEIAEECRSRGSCALGGDEDGVWGRVGVRRRRRDIRGRAVSVGATRR